MNDVERRFRRGITKINTAVDPMTPMLQAASMAAQEMLAPEDEEGNFAEKLKALGLLMSTANDLCTAHIEVLIQVAFKLEDMQHGEEERVH